MGLEKQQLEQLVQLVVTEVMKAIAPQLKPSTSCNCNGGCPCSESLESENSSRGFQFSGRLLSENLLKEIGSKGYNSVSLQRRCLITPLARDKSSELGIRICTGPEEEESAVSKTSSSENCLVIVSGHCSRSEERTLIEAARSSGWQVRVEAVCGGSFKHLEAAVKNASRLIESGQCRRAIILDEHIFRISQVLSSGSFPVKPAVCWDEKSAVESRCQGACNMLLISNRLLGLHMLGRIVRAWLKED
jgi:ribose 5-phosphate isomerase RpiB